MVLVLNLVVDLQLCVLVCTIQAVQTRRIINQLRPILGEQNFR